jgi:hypothetical protein
MLKTPSSAETEGGVMEIRPGCDGHYKLRDQIAMLPTPNFTGGRTAPDTHKTERRERGVKCGGEDLSTRIGASRIAMLPTPQSTDCTTSGLRDGYARNHSIGSVAEGLSGMSRGLKLQPAFVEHLMGYPIGFTEIEEN